MLHALNKIGGLSSPADPTNHFQLNYLVGYVQYSVSYHVTSIKQCRDDYLFQLVAGGKYVNAVQLSHTLRNVEPRPEGNCFLTASA